MYNSIESMDSIVIYNNEKLPDFMSKTILKIVHIMLEEKYRYRPIFLYLNINIALATKIKYKINSAKFDIVI